MLIPFIFGDEAKDLQLEKNHPNYYAWNQRLMARPAVQKIVKDKQAAVSQCLAEDAMKDGEM
jgi:glutathione S-transferase